MEDLHIDFNKYPLTVPANEIRKYIKRPVPCIVFFVDHDVSKSENLALLTKKVSQCYPKVFCYKVGWQSHQRYFQQENPSNLLDVTTWKSMNKIEINPDPNEQKLIKMFQYVNNELLGELRNEYVNVLKYEAEIVKYKTEKKMIRNKKIALMTSATIREGNQRKTTNNSKNNIIESPIKLMKQRSSYDDDLKYHRNEVLSIINNPEMTQRPLKENLVVSSYNTQHPYSSQKSSLSLTPSLSLSSTIDASYVHNYSHYVNNDYLITNSRKNSQRSKYIELHTKSNFIVKHNQKSPNLSEPINMISHHVPVICYAPAYHKSDTSRVFQQVNTPIHNKSNTISEGKLIKSRTEQIQTVGNMLNSKKYIHGIIH